MKYAIKESDKEKYENIIYKFLISVKIFEVFIHSTE